MRKKTSKKAKLKFKSPNSWEKVREIRKDLQNYENFPVKEEIELTWRENLEPLYKDIFKRDDDEKTSVTPLTAMIYYLEFGFYPPPEILWAIMECFGLYMQSGGDISLEEAFFGKALKGRGNYSQRKSESWVIEFIEFYLQTHSLKKMSKLDKVQEALDFLKAGHIYDADSICRTLRRRSSASTKKADNQRV